MTVRVFTGAAPRPDQNLLAPELVRDPHPYYAALRDHEPLHWNERHHAWLVTRYDDVSSLLHDDRLSSDTLGPYLDRRVAEADRERYQESFNLLRQWMTFADPPDHTRLRMLVNKTFSPRRVRELRDHVEQVVSLLLDDIFAAAQDSADGVADLHQGLAYLLPTMVTCALLGTAHADHDRLRTWSEDIGWLINGGLDVPDRTERAHRAVLDLRNYLDPLLARLRQEPGDNLLSDLLAVEAEGEMLTHDEVISQSIQLIDAGFKATVSLISTALMLLWRHPDQLERLRADPSLAKSTIEETLRFQGPAQMVARWSRADIPLHDGVIPEGQRVFLIMAAANRDPGRFENPDVLDIARPATGHLGFGQGRHYCLGAALARLQAEVAVGAAVERLPRTSRLIDDEPNWQPTLLLRSLRSLPMAMGAKR